MLSKNALVRALTGYADFKDEAVRARLNAFGPVLIKAAEIRKNLADDAEEKDPELMVRAMRGEEPVLRVSPVTIDRGALIESARTLGEALIASFKANGHVTDEEAAQAAALDWDALLTAEAVATAGRDPSAFLADLEGVVAPAELFDWFVLPVASLAVRAHLDPVACDLSDSYAPNRNTTVHETRPNTCPVCGGPAVLAAVVSTTNQGNAKKLFCSCCGASWPYERMRCVSCGEMAVSDLHYEHDQSDEDHRLHVCNACKDAFPTVFAVSDEAFSPDVEVIVMTGLEEAYANQNA